ncbi:hypothetical protein [uncultured Subdoligranulum sp.]|uniref:hypothetical protein n=1 Tax=uncultured Subdoligranulum sp. TaxID=512298 RepID=UPI002634758E|nr:hypothetical protein [uncultured Subdoligranulum sp.]
MGLKIAARMGGAPRGRFFLGGSHLPGVFLIIHIFQPGNRPGKIKAISMAEIL